MQKILTADQIKALDAATIATEPIASIDLMERASLSFVRWFVSRFNSSKAIGIVCGTGNNGGDGLAIARLLKERHYTVRVWIVRGGVNETPDFTANLQRLTGIETTQISSPPRAGIFDDQDILIDALFGSGLSRPLGDIYAVVVAEMNRAKAVRVAVDVPSGLMTDQKSEGEIVQSQYTVTFHQPKLAFMLPQSEKYVGNWHVVDIGLDANYIAKAGTKNFYVTEAWVRSQVRQRKKFAHKGDTGRSLLVSGSYGKMGAAVLAARALLRTGAGLLTVHVPAVGYEVLQTTVPEALVSVDKNQKIITQSGDLEQFDAVGIGPGIGTQKQTSKALAEVLAAGKPTVIDADGLNLLSEDKKLRKSLSPMAILTPHPGEFKRLAGKWSDDFERLELQRKFASDTQCVVVLKGAHTCIVSPDGRAYFNSTGNPAMATAGSGDVLTGMLTSLVAQGYDPTVAAIMGVFIHGRAGDMAASKMGGGSIIASDIVDMIPHSFQSVFH